MPKTDTRKMPVCYAPNTPPPESGYSLIDKMCLVVADLFARVYGLEKPVMRFEPVKVEEL